MVEVVVTPAAGVGVALGVLHGHVGTVELARKVSAPRRLGARAVRVLLRQRQLEFLQKDGAFGKRVGLLVDFVGSGLDVDVMILGKICLAAIERVRRQRRPDEDPFLEILREKQFAPVVVLRQVPSRGRGGVLRERLLQEDSAAGQRGERGNTGE